MADDMVVSASHPGEREAGFVAAPLDFEGFVNVLGGDQAMALGIIHEFALDLARQIEAISGALADADFETVRKVAHNIKGGAAVLSAHAVMDGAGIIEEIGRSGDLTRGQEELSALAGEAELLLGYCNELAKNVG